MRASDLPLPADYSNNGQVDAADYVMWRNDVGQPAGTLLNDDTGVSIGNQQYTLWRSNFGNVLGGAGALEVRLCAGTGIGSRRNYRAVDATVWSSPSLIGPTESN